MPTDCELIPEKANCSVVSPHNVRGNSSNWDCVLNDHPYSNLSLVLNKTTTIFPSKPGTRCRDNSSDVIFYYEEKRQHTCFSSFKAFVLLCSANSSMNGEYAIMGSGGDMTPGSQIEVKVLHSPNVVPIHSAKKEELHPAVYVVPVTFLITLSVAIAIVFLIILRNRKRTRDRRIITRVHSPSLKEVSFLKDDAEPRLHSPTSPGNCSLGDPLEFPRNRLYIYSNKILGEGSFGRVMQAKAQGIVPGMPDRNIVAVKTTKDNATGIEREELLAELQLMKYMEPHENILNLLGHCTTPGAPVCLIVEYASYGNLRDFLRQCEDVVLSLNHMPHMPRNRSRTRTMSTSSCGSTQPLLARNDSVFTPGSGNSHFVFPSPPPPGQGHMTSGSQSSDGGIKMTAHHPDATAVPLAHSVAPIGHDYLNTKGLVYMEDVHNFALQIACGLQHLAHMEIVHCDLAARNVLIAENFVLKIADFGLARDISGRELYKKNPRGKIPVKWTAPEALEHRVFTVKSDVWSYGILLWELFTYGHTPYPDVNLGTSYESFISFLKDGQRMGQPENCTAFFYDLMLQCWNFDPSLRPTPNDIVAQLTPSDSIFGDEEEEEGVDSGSAGTSTQPTSPKTTTSSGPAAGHQSSQE